MYHLTGKATKQVFKSAVSTASRRSTIAAAQRLSLIPANTQAMTFFVVNNNKQEQVYSYSRRSFSSLPAHNKLEMPNLSPTMEKVNYIFLKSVQGNIAKWLKKEGDSIKPGDILAQIETDKATVDFEMQEEGYIAKLMFPEGAKDVKLGTVVAIIVDNKDDVAKFKDYSASVAPAAPAAPKKEAPAPEAPKAAATAAPVQSHGSPQKASGGRIFISPIAKKIAEEGGLQLSGVNGSGPNGRIIKSDVEAAL